MAEMLRERVALTGMLSFCFFSGIESEFRLPLLHLKGWLRKGVASLAEEGEAVLRDEGDVEGANHHETQCEVSHQRAPDS